MKKATVMGVILLFIGLAFAPSIMADTPIFSKTIYVDDDAEPPYDGTQEHPYQFIQDGIDNASEGDTVFVSNGTYCENVVISKSITLVGENKDNTLIDGGGSGDVVYVSADNVNITDFKVRSGGSNSDDAGIELHGVQNCHIENNTISNSDMSYGIELSYSSNCTITGNTVSNNRNRGIWLSYSSNCTITGNTVSYNVGGIELSYSSNCTITGNTVSYNGDNIFFVDGFDGIYLLHSSNCTITGNTISNNYYWDGIFLYSSSNIIIKNCNIYSNGGGISLRESLNTQIHYCNIYGNQWSGVSNAYSVQYQADARWCWWGCIIGPTRLLKLNPFRRRDTVYGNVLFRPWLYHYHSAITNTKSSQMSMDLSLWFNIDWFPAKEPYDIP